MLTSPEGSIVKSEMLSDPIGSQGTEFKTNFSLLYLLVSTRAVIGQFKVDSVAKLFCDLSPTVLNFHSK